MLDAALESLDVAGVAPPVDVVGHSMGGVCALALAVERPAVVRRLVLVGACSGFAAVRRWSVPHQWRPTQLAWWQCLGWGTRQMLGLGSLASHKRLDNLVAGASFVDPRHVERWSLEPGDGRRPPPTRARWLRTARHLEYRHRLGDVTAPTLLLVGRHDPQTPPACTEELHRGIAHSRVVVFEHSGHSPFVEEPDAVARAVQSFLTG
jgi:proline iminopeptidase